MKRFPVHLALVVTFISLAVFGCKQYEDGPIISFRSKFERATNNWKAKYALRDGVDATAWFENWTLDMREDGRIVITDKDDNDSTIIQNGFWDLVNDDDQIRFQYTVPVINPDIKTVKILKLMEDELWFQDVTDTATWEYRLIPADTTN